MGKGNSHRGKDRDRDYDRGSEKFGQMSFGGGGQRFAGTMGGALGQLERHSDEHFALMMGVKNSRAVVSDQEKTLSANPDFVQYLKAKSLMLEMEKKMAILPEFTKYQQSRKDLRQAVAKMNESRARCEKCRFADPSRISGQQPQ